MEVFLLSSVNDIAESYVNECLGEFEVICENTIGCETGA